MNEQITCEEAARRLGITRGSVYRLLRARRLQGHRKRQIWNADDLVTLQSVHRYEHERRHPWTRPENGCRRCGLLGPVDEEKLCKMCVDELRTGRVVFYPVHLHRSFQAGRLVKI